MARRPSSWAELQTGNPTVLTKVRTYLVATNSVRVQLVKGLIDVGGMTLWRAVLNAKSTGRPLPEGTWPFVELSTLPEALFVPPTGKKTAKKDGGAQEAQSTL